MDLVKEGAEAQAAVQEQQRRTVSRRQLGKHEHFDEVSPEVGMLDEEAFDRSLAEDQDKAITMLGDMAAATDVRLAALARRVAGRLVLDLARSGRATGRGVGRWASAPAARHEGDIDVDASLEALQVARATGIPASLDDLRVMTWKRPETAICLLVDRSGSMHGNRLVTACVTAAGCAWRAPDDYSVVAFADDAWVMKALHAHRPAAAIVNDVLRLRGHGVTNLALALQTARVQLERSSAKRKVTILLSDCRQTTGVDPLPAARALDELAILAPEEDREDADLLAAAAGARVATIAGPFDATAAVARVLDR